MRKRKNKLNPLWFSLIVSLISLMILCFICAFILMRSENPSENLGIGTIMLFPICGSVCGLAGSLYKGENATKESLMASSICSLLLIVLGLILSGGRLSPSVLINSLVFILSSVIIAYLSRPKQRRRRY